MRFTDVKLQCGWINCMVVAPEGDGLVFTRTITLDGRKPREIDICKTHSDELDEILDPLLKDGRTVETGKKLPKAPKTAPSDETVAKAPSRVDSTGLDCQVPDCPKVGKHAAKGKIGLAQHVIKTHGYANLAAYYEDYPPSG